MTASGRDETNPPPARPARRLASAGLALMAAGVLGGGVWWQAQKGQVVPAARLSGDFHALRLLPDGRLLYGQHAGVSISADGGRTWSPADGAGDAMSLAASSEGVVMAGHDVLKVSRDGANSWQDSGFGNLPGTDIHGFAVAAGLPNVWYANIAGRGLFRTRNAQEWEFVSSATSGAMALAAGPGASPRLYALTMDTGLVVSDDGTAWRRAGEAPQASASGLDVHPVSGNVYIAGPSGVSRSEDKGATWSTLNLPEGALLVTADPREERNVYAVGESGLVYHSADGGKTWTN